ncbi:MAG: UDP-N-acetylmuramate--alanine ligase, partial [Sphingobacteriales bacterium]
VTNLEEDHLDVYNDLEDLVNTVRVFAKDAQIKICHTSVPLSVREGGLVYGEDVSCDYALALHQSVSTGVDVQFKKGGESWLVFNWRLPGKHNALNALAASAMASEVGVEDTVVVEALSSFEGVSRRFEIVYWGKKILVDDYAHHPSEIAKLEEGVNSHFPGKKILTIFQPHLYSRTADFMDGFAQSLSAFSQVWILPIYAAREEPMAGVSSEVLVEKIGPSARMVQKEDLLTSLDQVLAQFDIVLTVGAGDIDAFVPQIKEMLYETD